VLLASLFQVCAYNPDDLAIDRSIILFCRLLNALENAQREAY